MTAPDLRVLAFASVSIALLLGSAISNKMARDSLSADPGLKRLEERLDNNFTLISRLSESLQAQHTTLENELLSLNEKVDSAELMVNVSVDHLAQQEVQRIESKPEPRSQVSRAHATPEARAATRHLDTELLSLSTETMFGPFLDEIGIDEPRRSAIISELSRASYRVRETSLMRMSGEISRDEAREITSENTPFKALDALLPGITATEQFASYMIDRQEKTASLGAVSELAMRFNSTLPIEDMHAFATLYQSEVDHAGRTAVNNSGSEIYNQQLAGIERLRSYVSQTYNEEHAQQLNGFLATREAMLKQLQPSQQ